MKHYVIPISRRQVADIVVQANSQEEAFDIAEKCFPPDDTPWEWDLESHEVDREGWEDEQLRAKKTTAYKTVDGDAIIACPNSSVVGSKAEKKKHDKEEALYMARYPMSNFLDAFKDQLKKRKEKQESEE